MTARLTGTAAIIALIAGTAWADTTMSTDTDMDNTAVAVPAEQDMNASDDVATVPVPVQTDAQTGMAAEGDDPDTPNAIAATATAASNSVEATSSETVTTVGEETMATAETTDEGVLEVETTPADTEALTAGVALSPIDDSYRDKTVADLVGLDVADMNGEEVGEIEHIIEMDGQYAAIVGIGGFLGFGEHDVAVPLSEMKLTDDSLRLSNWTEEGLEAQPEVESYEALDGEVEVAQPL